MSGAKNVLLIDDNEIFRGALAKLLKLQGRQVTEAEDGKEAQAILQKQSFDIIISDIKMPEMDGVELLKWARANTQTPVILITGFSEILETTEAYRLGASDFLLKPFRGADIEAAIEKITRKETHEPEPNLDGQYCKIPIEDFVTGSRIHFSIFIRLSGSKFVRIAYSGEDLSMDQIRSYKSKDVQYVYVTREDFGRYVGFSVEVTRKLSKTRAISTEKKLNFLRFTGEVVLENLYVGNLDRETFEVAKDFTETALGIITENDAALEMLDALNSHADFIYAHSLGVSLYSVAVGRTMGWHSTPTLFKLSVGGLFHDIGLKEIPRSVLEKTRLTMKQDERQLYESHPIRGMELLNELNGFPTDGILIAYQHHEDCNALGYPKKLAKNKTHPLARVVLVADQFCEYAIKGPGTEGMPGFEAIAKMLQFGADRFDPEPLNALMKVFNFAPPATRSNA